MFEPWEALVSPGFFPRSSPDHCHPLPDSVASPEKQGPSKTAGLPWKHAHHPRQSQEFEVCNMFREWGLSALSWKALQRFPKN